MIRKILLCLGIFMAPILTGNTFGQSVDSAEIRLTLSYELQLAVYNAEYTKVVSLLSKGADVNSYSEEGITPLLYAINKGDAKLVDLLLENKANVDLHADNFTGETPLILSTKLGQHQIARSLLKNNASVIAADYFGNTALHYAALNNDTVLITEMVPFYKNIDDANLEGQTPLMYAASSGSVKAASILLNLGADANQADNLGFTPLMLSCQNGQYALAVLLLEHWARVNDVNKQGISALALAVVNRFPDVADLLLLNGAHASESYSISTNPYVLAAVTKQKNLADSLLKAGARRNYFPDFSYHQSIGIDTRFNDHDFMTGLVLLNSDVKFGMQLSLYYLIRPWAVAVLQENPPGVYYQFWERRQAAGLAIGKYFSLWTVRQNATGLFAEIRYEYQWGKYRGTDIPGSQGFRLYPGIGLEKKWNKTSVRLSLGYAKQNTRGLSDWNLGLSFLYDFGKKFNFNREINY